MYTNIISKDTFVCETSLPENLVKKMKLNYRRKAKKDYNCICNAKRTLLQNYYSNTRGQCDVQLTYITDTVIRMPVVDSIIDTAKTIRRTAAIDVRRLRRLLDVGLRT